MKSPFPGMDPYIERFWDDVGGSLIVYISDELNTVLPQQYRATLRPRLGFERGEYHQDFGLHIVPMNEPDHLITTIDILSPEQKVEGVGMTHFKRMQKSYRERNANRIWIDLLRDGDRMLEIPASDYKHIPSSSYLITIYHPNARDALYPLELRSQLPTLPIPLIAADEYSLLDIQPLLDRVYRNGRFRIDYSAPCKPPLSDEEMRAAREILKRHI